MVSGSLVWSARVGDTDWPSDDAPLYAGADRDYHANTDLLRRLRDVSRSIEMTIDGISIRTGYFSISI